MAAVAGRDGVAAVREVVDRLEASVIDLPPVMNEFFGGMINMDDPRHGKQRRIISRGFTPRALGQIEAAVERRARAIIDRCTWSMERSLHRQLG